MSDVLKVFSAVVLVLASTPVFAEEGDTAESTRECSDFEACRQACESGQAIGCSNLGVLYEFGTGAPKDPMVAVELYRKGCDGGDARGCESLAWIVAKGNVATVPSDADALQRAIALYQEACGGGDARYCYYFGKIFEFGNEVVARDPARALELTTKACDAGHGPACYDLARKYESGKGVSKDLALARGLYKKACDGSVRVACNKAE